SFRHPENAEFEDRSAVDPLEQAAKEKDLNYVKLDGEVGIIGNGAGLVMSTLDVVAYAGEEFGTGPANFLDIGGGASAQAVANGIVQALGLLHERGEDVSKPLVVRLDGNNAEEGRRILDSAANPLIERVDTMDGAAKRAAELAAAGKK